MRAVGGGYLEAFVPGVGEGTRYQYLVDERVVPDAFARFFPDGVHAPAMVVGEHHVWKNGGGVTRRLGEHVIYELHVGTFSPSGDHRGVRERLPELAALGITALELMPLAAFAGRRGWGYDGVALFAPHAAYGTPDELRALIDEAHGLGLAVLLDVVYNHLGPSGNYLPTWCRETFHRDRRTLWGDSLDYGHPLVRRLIVESAVHWLTSYRFDGLRLDATHAIEDASERHVVDELVAAVRALAPEKLVIAEDARNDPHLVTLFGLDAVWADDFHHQVAVTIADERDGYYASYRRGMGDLAQVINRGWLYEGQIDPATGEPRGNPAHDLGASSFVYCLENHDQVGNRAFGERLSARIPPGQFRAASTLLLFLPMTPLLFMGQEWGASSPFLFFTDHEAELGRAITLGRRAEFKTFRHFSDPDSVAIIPDPQDEATFLRSRLAWEERQKDEHARVLDVYRTMLALRRQDPVLRQPSRERLWARAIGDTLIVERWNGSAVRVLLWNAGPEPVPLAHLAPLLGVAPGATVLFRSDGQQSDDGSVIPPRTALILGTDAHP